MSINEHSKDSIGCSFITLPYRTFRAASPSDHPLSASAKLFQDAIEEESAEKMSGDRDHLRLPKVRYGFKPFIHPLIFSSAELYFTPLPVRRGL
jgi:hypothetical protein